MEWNAVAALAEVAGAVGVIASLLYLSAQIRQGAKASRLATSHSISRAVREWNQPILQDAELAWTFQVGVEDPSRLDEKERSRFYQLCFSFFRMFEDMHYQHEKGALDSEVWSGYLTHYGVYAKAPGMWTYFVSRREFFRPEFAAFLDDYAPPQMGRVASLVEQAGSESGKTSA